jgi:polyketide synthase PksL
VAGLIDSALDFDPRFFKLSGTEAELMDPQLRHLLMSVHRAIEDAGHTPAELANRRVGVFIGSEGSEYNDLHAAQAAAAGYGLNHAGCSLAHRISYHYDFKGPSEVIDTMCSSGAYCIYRATELLRSGEIDVAIVAAVKLHFKPATFEVLDGLGMTSRSQCRSFHRDSAGYVRSEGVVSLVLKRAEAARQDGDVIHARIREVAVNFSGRNGSSMFTPSKSGQKEAMVQCLRKAGVSVADLAYVEAQGMGNEISDFVEFSAINEACRELAGSKAVGGASPVISTLKPLLGHMECVSALGALLRIMLSLRTRRLHGIPGLVPEDIHPNLDASDAACKLLTADVEVEVAGDRPMLASLNSFGASGTNVHILVEQGDPVQVERTAPEAAKDRLLPISAASLRSLGQSLAQMHAFLSERGKEVSLDDLCHSFQTRREHQRHRVVIALKAAPREQQMQALLRSLLAAEKQLASGDAVQGHIDELGDAALRRTAAAWLRGEAADWSVHHDVSVPRRKISRLPTTCFDLKPYRLNVEAAAVQTALDAVPGDDIGDIRSLIVATLSTSLKIDAADISNDAPFADYGVDSITAVNLIRALNEGLQLQIDTTVLFDHSSVNRLSAYVRGVLPSGPRAVAAKAVPRNLVAPSGGKEPIAIIGMSGRFAESETLDEFWQHLRAGRNLVKDVTRWPREACTSTRPGQCTQGSFVESIDQFDPFFFNISPLEALYMDPQQRLFLEESWKALEDAGYAGKGMDGRRCGVYTGANFTDYNTLFDAEPPEQAFWGVAGCVIPARISYYLNLLGPAVMVDTACSSSLVAIHTACQSLWSGENEMALAGAVFLQSTPMFFQYANRAGMLSANGRCATFDAGADGFVPGEGVGVVVLKRLADALRDGDSIHGVIVGSGINQDGKTNGITAPSAKSQEELECAVYDGFGIHPGSIQMVETHGTGTKLGDPIEFAALQRSFSRYTDQRGFCAIGSVKTNVGHTSAAAGMAGLLKILLALKHREMPPSLHFKEGNPLIDFASSAFYVNTRLQDWPVEDEGRRRAAISSFGFSGTNAHMVVEEAPAPESTAAGAPAHLVVLSACSAEQLKQQASQLMAFVEARPALPINDVAHTLLVGRMHRGHRLACIVRNGAELIERLRQWLASGSAPGLTVSEIQEGKVVEQAGLRSLGQQCIQECRRAEDAAAAVEKLATVAELYGKGYELDFAALFPKGSRRIPLPTYPFARERFWIDGDVQKAAPRAIAARTDTSVIHELLTQIEAGVLDEDLGVQKLKELM